MNSIGLPEWLDQLPSIPAEWGWIQGEPQPNVNNGVFFPTFFSGTKREFDFDSVCLEQTRWFFERGFFAVVQPRPIEKPSSRVIHGLAVYRLCVLDDNPGQVFHVTLQTLVPQIRAGGINTARESNQHTSTWKECKDFVHVWIDRASAENWPECKKLKKVCQGPWSVIEIEYRDRLFRDPKCEEEGGYILACGECIHPSMIVDDYEI